MLESEKEKTFRELGKSAEELIVKELYKVVELKGKRTYAGTKLRSCYQDQKQNEFQNVENLALRFYNRREGWSGMHSENAFMKHLYGLLFWEVIYCDTVPYVFQTPY